MNWIKYLKKKFNIGQSKPVDSCFNDLDPLKKGVPFPTDAEKERVKKKIEELDDDEEGEQEKGLKYWKNEAKELGLIMWKFVNVVWRWIG